MTQNVKEITSRDFEETIRHGLTLVDFFASWCGPCRSQTPILEKVAEKVAGRVVIAKLNIDDAPDTATQYKVMSVPTLVLFCDGQERKRFIGVQPEVTLLEALGTS